MATLEQIRQNLVARVEDARASFTDYQLVVEYDNRKIVDMQAQAAPYLCAEIAFLGGSQLDLSNHPMQKITGMLILTAKVSKGSGTSEAYKLLDHFYPKIQRTSVSGVHTLMAEIDKPRDVSGWAGISALIPFHVNNVT